MKAAPWKAGLDEGGIDALRAMTCMRWAAGSRDCKRYSYRITLELLIADAEIVPINVDDHDAVYRSR